MAANKSEGYTLLARLADEFAARYRRGERPPLKEYIDRYPELADDIRDLFPAMAEIEQAKEDQDQAIRPTPEVPPLEQLGDFRILREVGRGGMGVVYEAEQVSLGRHVALKVMPQKALLDAKQKRRFEREARAAGRLHHTNIVPVFGVGEHDGLPYYVMQFIQGLGLDEVIQELKRLQRPGALGTPPASREPSCLLPRTGLAQSLMTGQFERADLGPDQAEPTGTGVTISRPASAPASPPTPSSDTELRSRLSTGSSASILLPGQSGSQVSGTKKPTYWQSVSHIGAQVAEALEYAHKQGVLHRDVKPSNLLLDTRGTVWVTDFGVAKVEDQPNLTRAGDIVGTLHYLAPEAFEGQADVRSDIYSLGLTLYELLALRPAFAEKDRHRLIKQVTSGEPPRLDRLNPAIPRDLITIVHKAIDRDPAHRYQTAGELAADLQHFADDQPIRARRASLRERLVRWARHHPGLAASLAIMGLMLVGVALAAIIAAARFRSIAQERSEAAEAKTRLATEKEQERVKAVEARDDANAVRRRLEITVSDMHTGRGLLAADRRDAAQAMLWFANAARQAKSDPARQRANRARVRAWARLAPLPVWAHPFGVKLRHLEFGPGGRYLLTLTYPGRCQIWDWAQDQSLPLVQGPVAVTCWGPEGRWLALGFASGVVEIRQLPAGKLLQWFNQRGPVTALTCSRDGRYLAVAGNTVQVWDRRKGAYGAGPWEHPKAVHALAFNPAGDRLATIGDDQQVRVFAPWARPARRTPLFAPLPHRPCGKIYDVPSPPAYIDGGRQLVTITGPRELTCWDAETGQPTPHGKIPTGPSELGRVIASPDGRSFAASGFYGAQVWQVGPTIKASPVLSHRHFVQAMAYSPGSRTLLTVSQDTMAKLWSLPDGKLVGAPLPHQDELGSAVFSSDRVHLATAQGNGLVRVWRLPAGNPQDHALACEGRSLAASLSPDGRYAIASWSHFFGWPAQARHVRVYDLETGRPAGPDFPLDGDLRGAVLSPDGRSAAAISVRGTAGRLHVWDFRSGQRLRGPLNLPGPPLSLAFDPKGSRIAVLCAAGDLLVFPLRKDRGPQVISQKNWAAFNFLNSAQVQFTPDGTALVTSDALRIRVRDVRTGKLRYPPLPVAEAARGETCADFSISGDSRFLATALWEGRDAAQVWDLATGKPLSKPLPHPNRLFQIRISRDGRRILTACCDGQARLWDWKRGMLACPPLQHGDEVRSVALTPDRRWGLTAGKDGFVRLWDLVTGKPVLPSLGGPGHSLELSVVAARGGRRAVGAGSQGMFLIDLGDLYAEQHLSVDDLCTAAELAAGQRVLDGDLAGLTSNEWISRWEKVQRHHPHLVRGEW
jgi:serine/threonine protein kinase/WD40 repeat protein